MLHIILLMLKIIGILLLCLLGLLLLNLCLILFVPLFFEAEAENQDSFRAKGRLSWMGLGLRAGFSYEEELEFSLRIFGLRIFPSKKKKRKRKKEDKERSPASEAKAAEEKKEGSRVESPDKKEAKSHAEESNEAGQKRKTEQNIKEEQEVRENSEKSEEASSKKEKPSSKRKIPGRFLRKKRKEEKKEKKKKEKSAFFKKVKEILGDEVCREGIIHTMSYLISFFQAVRMKDAEGNVDFSLGAPDLTGKTLGVISMFPFAYGKDLEINPDFMADNSYFTGRIRLKGSLQLVYLLIFIIRMGMDKEVRKVIFSLMGKK